MSSWFDLDITSLQDQLTKSVEEASRIIGEVNNLEILNLDAMAEREEQLDEDDINIDADEEDEIIIHEPQLYKQINDNINNNDNTILLNEKTNINKKIIKLNIDDHNDFNWSNDLTNPIINNNDISIDKQSFDGISNSNALHDNINNKIDNSNIVDLDDWDDIPIKQIQFNQLPISNETKQLDDNTNNEINNNVTIDKSDNKPINELKDKNILNEIKSNKKKRKNKKSKNKSKTLDFWGLSDTTNESNESNYITNHSYIDPDIHITIHDNHKENETIDNTMVNIVQSLPQNIVNLVNLSSTLNISNNLYNYSYFDKVDEEIDLDNDPILLQIEKNKININNKMNELNHSNDLSNIITQTINQWSSYTQSTNDPIETVESNDTPINTTNEIKLTIFQQIINYLTIIFICIKDRLSTIYIYLSGGPGPIRAVSQTNTDRLPARQRYRRYALYMWETVSSAYGLSGLTAFLLLCTYYKLQRQRSDIGGLN